MDMDAVALLQRMVEIESLSREEQALARYLADVMGQMGFEAQVDEVGNAVGMRQQESAEGQITRELVLLGHMDTVPGNIPVRIEGCTEGRGKGCLYGRGSVDAKGPLATFIMATAQAELPAGTRVIVIGAVEEESATSRGARHVATRYQPDACIIGEPSNWDAVTLGYKGRLLIDYSLEQPMSHTAGAQGAVAERAIDWWLVIRQYAESFNEGRKRLFEQLLPSVRDINSSSDGTQDSVQMKLGIRLPPNFDVEAFNTIVREAAGEATLYFYAHEPAYQASRATSLVRSFQRAIRKQGSRPRFKVKTGTSDMNVVGPIWQCPILAYGPGDSQLDHTPNEHIEIAEYLRAIEVLRTVLEI
jgi:LysW-gamma-L-lysine carboxypeptidase